MPLEHAILAFDHRRSLLRSFFGVEGDPTPDVVARVKDAKALIADALVRAVRELRVPTAAAAGLIDATYGEGAIAALRGERIRVAVPVEESDRPELTFEDTWRERLTTLRPDWAKVLVRWNPRGDTDMNARQLASLVELQRFCDANDLPLMLELLMPPEPEQAGPTFDAEVRPGLVVEAIARFREVGIQPSLWKIEGFERRTDCEAVAAVAGAPCVVLGRGLDAPAVDRWLEAGRDVEGFVGFAIGRTIWGEALEAWNASSGSDGDRRAAIDRIAAAYAHATHVWAG